MSEYDEAWMPPLPDPCREEKPAPDHIGDGWWECTRDADHDGDHYDEQQGHRWPRRSARVSSPPANLP